MLVRNRVDGLAASATPEPYLDGRAEGGADHDRRARNGPDDASLSAAVVSRRPLQGDNPGVTRSGQFLPKTFDDGIPLGDLQRQHLDVLDERADKAAQFGNLGAAHGAPLGFECADTLLWRQITGTSITCASPRRSNSQRYSLPFAMRIWISDAAPDRAGRLVWNAS